MLLEKTFSKKTIQTYKKDVTKGGKKFSSRSSNRTRTFILLLEFRDNIFICTAVILSLPKKQYFY